jgi:hypothetical protein
LERSYGQLETRFGAKIGGFRQFLAVNRLFLHDKVGATVGFKGWSCSPCIYLQGMGFKNQLKRTYGHIFMVCNLKKGQNGLYHHLVQRGKSGSRQPEGVFSQFLSQKPLS